jgi:hypothetical protein
MPVIDFNAIFLALILIGLLVFGLAVLGYVAFTFLKHRDRESKSLESVLLQVAVPRGNEIKIDAMEQMFASLASLKKGGFKQKFSFQPTISFEIVARKEDIRFYIWTPNKYKDLIEKQIHGAYQDAEILEVPEYNIFNETGKVAYKSFQLAKENYYPIKTFKDLATDPMASITSGMAKMGDGEAAVLQVVVSPADTPWQKEGGSYIRGNRE